MVWKWDFSPLQADKDKWDADSRRQESTHHIPSSFMESWTHWTSCHALSLGDTTFVSLNITQFRTFVCKVTGSVLGRILQLWAKDSTWADWKTVRNWRSQNVELVFEMHLGQRDFKVTQYLGTENYNCVSEIPERRPVSSVWAVESYIVFEYTMPPRTVSTDLKARIPFLHRHGHSVRNICYSLGIKKTLFMYLTGVQVGTSTGAWRRFKVRKHAMHNAMSSLQLALGGHRRMALACRIFVLLQC